MGEKAGNWAQERKFFFLTSLQSVALAFTYAFFARYGEIVFALLIMVGVFFCWIFHTKHPRFEHGMDAISVSILSSFVSLICAAFLGGLMFFLVFGNNAFPN